MAVAQRGQIVLPNRAKQIKDFSGLLFASITPTDIDGLIEYHGKGYVLIELKLGDAQVPQGQRLALKRLTDDLQRANRLTLCLIAKHETVNCDEVIDVANAIVSEYRYKGQWHEAKADKTVRQFIEKFMELV